MTRTFGHLTLIRYPVLPSRGDFANLAHRSGHRLGRFVALVLVQARRLARPDGHL